MKAYKVEKAMTVNSKGNLVGDGWDLFTYDERGNVEWCQRFYYKSSAVAAKKELEEGDHKRLLTRLRLA